MDYNHARAHDILQTALNAIYTVADMVGEGDKQDKLYDVATTLQGMRLEESAIALKSIGDSLKTIKRDIRKAKRAAMR